MSTTERVEQTIRCPRCTRDPRWIARVVVRGGARFLDLRGGKSGHGARLREEFVSELERSYTFNGGNISPAHAAFLAKLERLDPADLSQRVHGWSLRLDALDPASFAPAGPGRPPVGFRAVCRGCNALHSITVEMDAGRPARVTLHAP